MNYLSSDLLKVLQFASRAHDKQLRKSPPQTPYISHPFAVGLILSKAGFRDEVVMAGILHDVLEDTNTIQQEIVELFGNEVAQFVLAVTENKELVWPLRKQAYNDNLARQTAEVAAISAADLIANRQSLLIELKKGEDPWINFSQAPQEYVKNILRLDRERIAVISSLLPDHPLVEELETLEREVTVLTSSIYKEM